MQRRSDLLKIFNLSPRFPTGAASSLRGETDQPKRAIRLIYGERKRASLSERTDYIKLWFGVDIRRTENVPLRFQGHFSCFDV